MTKKEIRSHMKRMRDNLSKEEKMKKDTQIRENLLTLPKILDSENIFLYVSFGSEIDTLVLIEELWKRGKRIFVPKVEDNVMDFYEITSFDELVPGFYGILEPVTTKCMSGMDGVMIMPGLAFDQEKNRIGYGGGYYDRYLARYPEHKMDTIAAAYDFQVVEKLETEEYDFKADILVTESGII